MGLTGPRDQLEKVWKGYRVYVMKGIDGSPDDYLMDHSITLYLMDQNARFLDFFGSNMSEEAIAKKILVDTNRETVGMKISALFGK